jgi:hypothetical protein
MIGRRGVGLAVGRAEEDEPVGRVDGGGGPDTAAAAVEPPDDLALAIQQGVDLEAPAELAGRRVERQEAPR